VGSLLKRYRPKLLGRYARLYRDCHHEVQYSRGSWTLVRGPVPRRTDNVSIFLGLHLRGATRRQLLSVPPRPARSAEAFWTQAGEPCDGGLCMGATPQYQHLSSDAFSDAEAIIQWLDGGVILATGRSALHQAWREAGHSAPFEPVFLLGRRRRRLRVE
jgi:hypothetical protein